MTSIFDKRWNKAKQLATTIKNCAYYSGNKIFFVSDNIFIDTEQLIIDEETKSITVKCDNCAYLMYYCNPDFDDGAHLTIKQIEEEFKSKFKIYKELVWF